MRNFWQPEANRCQPSNLLTMCPVCKDPKARPSTDILEGFTPIECPRCGKFSISRFTQAAVEQAEESDPDARLKISHAIRRAQSPLESPRFTKEIIENVVKRPLPRFREQADLLLKFIGANSSEPGKHFTVYSYLHRFAIGAKSAAGFKLNLRHLEEEKLLLTSGYTQAGDNPQEFFGNVALTFKGWDRFEESLSGGISYKRAFMAMKFGDMILDDVFTTVFKPAAKAAGFELRKLDEDPRAGLIDNRMRVEIQNSDFVVADLTHDNRGAYWEAGYAEGLGKPVIYTCERGKFEKEQTHFDTSHHHTIIWERGNPTAAHRQLTDTIRATLPHLSKMTDE